MSVKSEPFWYENNGKTFFRDESCITRTVDTAPKDCKRLTFKEVQDLTEKEINSRRPKEPNDNAHYGRVSGFERECLYSGGPEWPWVFNDKYTKENGCITRAVTHAQKNLPLKDSGYSVDDLHQDATLAVMQAKPKNQGEAESALSKWYSDLRERLKEKRSLGLEFISTDSLDGLSCSPVI